MCLCVSARSGSELKIRTKQSEHSRFIVIEDSVWEKSERSQCIYISIKSSPGSFPSPPLQPWFSALPPNLSCLIVGICSRFLPVEKSSISFRRCLSACSHENSLDPWQERVMNKWLSACCNMLFSPWDAVNRTHWTFKVASKHASAKLICAVGSYGHLSPNESRNYSLYFTLHSYLNNLTSPHLHLRI